MEEPLTNNPTLTIEIVRMKPNQLKKDEIQVLHTVGEKELGMNQLYGNSSK